ncbi:nucleoporin 160 [Homo sapiens]|nr:nuclear pore complex protein Nup160 isoform 2 [Homo sapiens]EAW67881.1 nucleoporin 160kDa, isoform CRA_d [Homo sapiens]KAI2559814.1 nucleoporin 160 [Homo sapiens]KAI4071157.1 nucleoporin 160 [Homo sapiens]|eukprot:NP_001305328.1 nuclear pore complex protein Nup160 isoform 2 [Homo sapiens]
MLHLSAAPPAPPPEVTATARPCLCSVGRRGDGGKMAAAGALERSFVELSGAERERPRHFREFTVCSIGTANAVAGAVKYSESAGGFYYVESGKLFSVTRNRFIHWKTSGDTLELMEESLDINLLNNAIRLKFQNCSVLPGGVYVSETQNRVIILMLTNQTVHRLLLPHPSRMYRSVSWLSAISFISQITLGVTNVVLERCLLELKEIWILVIPHQAYFDSYRLK